MRRRRKAFSLLEVTIATALMAVLLMVLGMALKSSQDVFRNTLGLTDVNDQVRRLALSINRDLQRADLQQIGVTNAPASLVAPDSSAIWMLSNVDPLTNRPCYRSDGKPFWVRNILYYTSIPQQHSSLYGFQCAGGAGPDGFDDRCPHKFMIRKLIDSGAPTNLADDSTCETLLSTAQVSAYMTRANGASVRYMTSEPGVTECRLLSPLLLGFQCQITQGQVNVNLRSVSLPRAQRKVSIGTASLYDSPFTYHFGLTVVPEVR